MELQKVLQSQWVSKKSLQEFMGHKAFFINLQTASASTVS